MPVSVKTLADYVQWCKTNPDKASYGTTSAGATPHFAGVMLSNESKVTLNPVHYRGGAQALQDVVGGHIPMSVNPLSAAFPLHQGGTIRAPAVTGATRSQCMPTDHPAEKARLLHARWPAGYFGLAGLSTGLACGPMSGFDNQKVDDAFVADGRWKSNFLCTLGKGDPSKVMERLPRLSFDEACKIV